MKILKVGMKQRVKVVGLIKAADEILLLKRRQNRFSGSVVWEFPSGKLCSGEQPEEAMSRVIFECLGVRADVVVLHDAVVIAATNETERESQLCLVYEIEFERGMRIKATGKHTAYKYTTGADRARMSIDEVSRTILSVEQGERVVRTEVRGALNGATVYVDGCSKGNPGPAGVGYYIEDVEGNVLAQGGEYIGFATSREAEYHALKFAMEKAIELGLRNVRFISDNLMMVNQMNGIYRVKNLDLKEINHEIRQMTNSFEACVFEHVKREQNRIADHEANKAVIGQFGEKMIK